jgi:hypothetical protein
VKLSPALKVAADKTRAILFLQSVIAALYVVLILWAFWYAVKHWPIEGIPVAAQIRATANEIANDLNHVLTRYDQFLSANPFGFPTTLEYYMVQRDGSFPRHGEFDVLASPERVIDETASRCKAILVFSNSEDQLRYSTAPKPALTVWEAIAQWVKDPRNGYRLIKTYRFPDQTPWSHLSGNFTMELYVRAP